MTASEGTQSYLTLAAPARSEIEVRRSRFVCDVAPVTSEDAARAAIEHVRGVSRGAGHHCTAFVLGPDAATLRSNDDGEPSGTAGAPMLDVLRGHGLTDVVAVVTLRRRELHQSLVVALDHLSGPRLENALHGIRGVKLGDVDYSPTGMRLHLVVAPASTGAVTASIAAITSGSALVTPGPMTWVDVPVVA